MRDLVDSSSSWSDTGALRGRLAADGVLLLRGVLDPRDLALVHRRLATIARDAGWLRADAPLEDALVDPAAACADSSPAHARVYRELFRVEALHALPHAPALITLFERLLGGPVFSHPRLVVRAIFPGAEFATRAHQDHRTLGGTRGVYTVWIPLTDCPRVLGGLEVAVGSHLQGIHAVRPAPGIGGEEVVDPMPDRWASADVRRGDVIVFHSLVVHRSCPNLTERLRLSVDARFQLVREPVHPMCFVLAHGGRSWPDTYRDWEGHHHLRHYWRRLALRFEPPVRELLEPRRADS